MDYDEMDRVLGEIDDSLISAVISGKQNLSDKQRYAIRAYLVSMADTVGEKLYNTKRLSDSELAKKCSKNEYEEIIISTLHTQESISKLIPTILGVIFIFFLTYSFFIGK